MYDTSQLDYGPVRADEIDALNGLLEQALTFKVGSMAPWTQAIGHANMRAVRRNGRARLHARSRAGRPRGVRDDQAALRAAGGAVQRIYRSTRVLLEHDARSE